MTRDYKAIAKKTAETIKKKYGEDYYKKIGKKGGRAHDAQKSVATVAKKYGQDYYVKQGYSRVENFIRLHGKEGLKKHMELMTERSLESRKRRKASKIPKT